MNPVTMVKAYAAFRRVEKAWKELTVKREPVMVAGVIRAVVYLGAIFGLYITEEQTAALIIVGELGFGLLTRMHVSPVSRGQE